MSPVLSEAPGQADNGTPGTATGSASSPASTQAARQTGHRAMHRIPFTQDRDSVGYQALLLGGFALTAAALLVLGNLVTRGPIAKRQAEDIKASLAQVIPADLHDNDLLANSLSLPTVGGETIVVYRALQGLAVEAVAFEVTAAGYAGPIRILMGIDAGGRVIGARVLAHSETPGLGDKIELGRDDWILGFNGLSLVEPTPEHWAVKKDGGRFDQFSGATITPRAVVAAIKGGLETFATHRDALTASAVIVSSDLAAGDAAKPVQAARSGQPPGATPQPKGSDQ